MSSWNIVKLFSLEDAQVIANDLPRHFWLDDIVDKASLGANHWVGKSLGILSCVLLHVLATEDDFDCTLGTHYSEFGPGPGVVCITTKMFACHYIVRSSVCLTSDHGNLGNRGFGVSKKQLGAVTDDSSVFLAGTR